MSDTLLRDEAITLLLAGHETTALAHSWTWFLLGQHPDAQSRMAAEIAEVLGDRPASADDLPTLKFTESVVTEAMRLYPPAWAIGRESTQPFELGGYSFPTGTIIFIIPWVLHRDSRYFEEPEAFRPSAGLLWPRGPAGSGILLRPHVPHVPRTILRTVRRASAARLP